MRPAAVGGTIGGFVATAVGLALYSMRAAAGGPPPRSGPTASTKGLGAVVVGATGATGRQIVRRLCESERWSSVTAVVRRTPAAGELFDTADPPPKLRVQVIDMERLQEDAVQDDLVRAMSGAHTFFNALGTTRGAAGSAAAFTHVEVTLTARLAELARRAGIPCASVVSASGANPRQWVDPWEAVHPLLYVRSLGQKEEGMAGFEHLSIFRPGMLNRLKGDRLWENVVNRAGLGLRVDTLAAAMEIDAAAMASARPSAQPGGSAAATGEAKGEEPVQLEPVVYQGNSLIKHWGAAESWAP